MCLFSCHQSPYGVSFIIPRYLLIVQSVLDSSLSLSLSSLVAAFFDIFLLSFGALPLPTVRDEIGLPVSPPSSFINNLHLSPRKASFCLLLQRHYSLLCNVRTNLGFPVRRRRYDFQLSVLTSFTRGTLLIDCLWDSFPIGGGTEDRKEGY